MNKQEKETYRKKLLDKKQEISHSMSEFFNESKEVESGIAQDVVDRAESSYTKEFLLSLSDAEREQLFLIDEALKRLDTDDFGVCQRCRVKLSKKRLSVVPWAPYCVECQEKEEAESS